MARPVTEPALMDALDRFTATVEAGDLAEFLDRHDVYAAELKAAGLACTTASAGLGTTTHGGAFVLGFCLALDLLEHGYLA